MQWQKLWKHPIVHSISKDTELLQILMKLLQIQMRNDEKRLDCGLNITSNFLITSLHSCKSCFYWRIQFLLNNTSFLCSTFLLFLITVALHTRDLFTSPKGSRNYYSYQNRLPYKNKQFLCTCVSWTLRTEEFHWALKNGTLTLKATIQ